MASPAEVDLISKLTDRQLEIVRWVSQCKSNWEIAVILGLTENTVKKHLFRTFKILGLSKRMEAAALLRETLPEPRPGLLKLKV